jgi:hypothetical protein
MSELDKERIRKVFGRDFSDSELEYFGSRLVRLLNAIERLQAWEPELGLIEPATVPRVIKTEEP